MTARKRWLSSLTQSIDVLNPAALARRSTSTARGLPSTRDQLIQQEEITKMEEPGRRLAEIEMFDIQVGMAPRW